MPELRLLPFLVACTLLPSALPGQIKPWESHGPLRVHASGRHIEHEDGTPFFWLGDTAWQMFVALDEQEVATYLDNRLEKKFNVIQVVALAEYGHKLGLRGLGENRRGHFPLTDSDPGRPATKAGADNDYWDFVEYVVNEAESRGLYVGLLPVWGCNSVSGVSNGIEPIFDEANARSYGEFIGRRFRDAPNLIWIMGGDDNPVKKLEVRPIYRAMAEGVAHGVTGKSPRWDADDPAWDELLMCFHPRGNKQSSAWFHKEPWLDFNMLQVGHAGGLDNPNSYRFIEADRALKPPKPVIDAEPPYEDHPDWKNWRKAPAAQREQARFRDFDVRQAAYWSLLSGAAGYTYGHHAVWPFYRPEVKPINFPDRTWTEALDRPGAQQMRFVREFCERYHYEQLTPDRTWVSHADDPYVAAAVGPNVAVAYFPHGKSRKIRHPRGGDRLTYSWFDVRNGTISKKESHKINGLLSVDPPGASGRGNDWVLVVDLSE